MFARLRFQELSNLSDRAKPVHTWVVQGAQKLDALLKTVHSEPVLKFSSHWNIEVKVESKVSPVLN
jgi:hypothetical protein